MFKQLIVVWSVLAIAIAITAALVPSVNIDGGILSLLGVALLVGLVNAIIRPRCSIWCRCPSPWPRSGCSRW